MKTSIGKAFSLLFDLGRNFLFIKALSVEAFGLLSLGNNFVQSNKYLDLGFANKFLIDSYDGSLKSLEAKEIFYSIIIFEALLLIFFGIGFLLIFSTLDSTFKVDDTHYTAGIVLPLMILLAFFSARIYKLSIIWMRHKQNFVHISILEIIVSASFLLGSFLVLVIDFFTFTKSYFFIQGVFFLLCSIVILKKFPGTKKRFSWLLANWKPSIILTSSTILYGLSFYFDRYILVKYYGLTEIGNYAFLLFILNFGTAIISYGVEPVRAYIAKSFSNAHDDARHKIVTDICLISGLYLSLIGICIIYLTIPQIKLYMPIFFEKYILAIHNLEGVLIIFLTLPTVYLLGYLIISKSFNQTGLFALSQLAGIFCMAMSFFIIGVDKSIYSTLLLGIYYGNVLKIFIFISLIDYKQKARLTYIYHSLLLSPFLIFPILSF